MIHSPAALLLQPWRIAALVAVLAIVALGRGGTAEAAPRSVQGGSLDWGIKASFRSYITGPIAHGAIAATGGATQTGNGFRFNVQPGGNFDSATNTLTVSMIGGVHFTGHDGTLDMTVSNLRVQLAGNSGTLMADVTSKSSTGPSSFPGVVLVNLVGGVPSPTATGATWAGIQSSLSPSGAPAFGGFYTPGTAFDPLAFTLMLSPDTALANQQQVQPTPVPFLQQQPPYSPPVQPQFPLQQPIQTQQPFVPNQLPQTTAPLPFTAPTPVMLAPLPSTQNTAPPQQQQQAPAQQPVVQNPTSRVSPPATGDAGLLINAELEESALS